MTTVEATLADLELLAGGLRRLDDDLRPWSAPLADAVDRAWATNPGLLGPLPAVDGEFDGLCRRSHDLIVELDDARRRLAEAGGSTLLWAAGGSATLRHLAAASAAPSGGRMNETLWRLLATALFGRAPRRPAAPYVVSTTTETLALSWMVDSSLTYIRQVLSDGTVRMTELLETGSSLVGVGLGGHCSAAVDGHTLIEHGVLLSASVDAAGAAGRTWVFAGQRAADRWWQQRRNAVMTSALVRAVGGRALAALHRWVTGHEPDTPDGTFEQLSLEAGATATSSTPLSSGSSGVSGAMTVRHDDDGTITVAAPVGLAVTDEVGLHPFAAVARSGGRFEVGAELTMRDGHLAGIALRSVAVDRAGLDVGRDGGPSLARTTGDDEALSVYETTIELDLTDEAVRSLVDAALPAGPGAAGAAVLAGLGTLVVDEQLVRAASVTVVEHSVPSEQLWQLSCSWDLAVGSGSFGATTGHTSEQTRHIWRKDPGATLLRAVG